MPIIKSAKKRMRQTAKRTELNKGTRTRIKTYSKKVIALSKKDPEEAKKMLPTAYKVIDTACKKNILHKNTAARRKSLLARTIARAEAGGGKKAVKEPAAPKAAKKAEAKEA
ncbi:30S ribosomal protein S20 [Pseudomonadota bacterium]